MATDKRTIENYEEEIARLKLENETLRRGGAERFKLDATKGAKAHYRVKLPAVQMRDGTWKYVPVRNEAKTHVHPHRPLPGYAPIPERLRVLPEEYFSMLDLKVRNISAWEAYKEKHPNTVTDADREFFRFPPVLGPERDFLVVEAVSPADAFEIFRRYCGITRTVQQPVVERGTVDDKGEFTPEQQAAAA